MNMKRNYSFRYRIPLLSILVFFALTFFIYNDFNIRMIFGYIALIASATLYLIFNNSKIYLSKEKRTYLVLSIIISIYALIGGQENAGVYVMAVLICAVFTIVGEIDEKQVFGSMKMLFIAGSLFSLYVISVRVSPNIYYSFTRNIISAQSASMNDQLLRDGYGITLGGNIVFIDYVLTLGIMLAFNTILAFKKNLRFKWLYYSFTLLSIVGMLFENRKSELLAAFIGCCFCYRAQMNLSTTKERASTRGKLIFIAAIAIAFLIYLGSTGYLDRYLIFFERLNSNYHSTNKIDVTSGRTYLWALAFSLFRKEPVFGIGWSHFQYYLPSYLGHLDNVHNNYIQLLCETGLLGFVLIVTPMVRLLIFTVKRTKAYLKQELRNPLSMVTNITSYGLQISFFVLSFLDPCWYKMSFWPFFAIAMMLSNASNSLRGGEIL